MATSPCILLFKALGPFLSVGVYSCTFFTENVIQDYNLQLLYAIDLRTDHAQSLVDSYNQDQCKVLAPSEQEVALSHER